MPFLLHRMTLKSWQYQIHICFLGFLQIHPIPSPIVVLLQPMGTQRAVSDWLVQEVGVVAEMHFDWSSKACYVQWAQEASLACTQHTWLLGQKCKWIKELFVHRGEGIMKNLCHLNCVHCWGGCLRHYRARHQVKAARCLGRGLFLEDGEKKNNNLFHLKY